MILSIANNRIQSGKTTTAINVAIHLSMMKKKVIFVDLDPQATATIEFKRKSIHSTYDLLKKKKNIAEIVQKTEYENLYLIPSNINMTYIEKEFYKNPNEKQLLGELLKYLGTKFEFVIVDLPPYIGAITTISLIHSDSILIPLKLDHKIFQGVYPLLKMVKTIQATSNSHLHIAGILPTYLDPKSENSIEALNMLINDFDDYLMKKSDDIILILKNLNKKLLIHSKENRDYMHLIERIMNNNKEEKEIHKKETEK